MDIGGILEFTPLCHRACEGFSIPALLHGDDICFCGKVPLSNCQSRTTSASHIPVPRRRPLIVEATDRSVSPDATTLRKSCTGPSDVLATPTGCTGLQRLQWR